MKKLIKTLTLVTTGLVVGVAVGRVSKSYKIEKRLVMTKKGFQFKPTLKQQRR